MIACQFVVPSARGTNAGGTLVAGHAGKLKCTRVVARYARINLTWILIDVGSLLDGRLFVGWNENPPEAHIKHSCCSIT